ncbi:hypothetical protein GobsT_12490 [Gemmata obscuriglobus]|uniref:Uncharacterized protein n=1 Tax=Gemmata obscuriglobus TaxID=114 RepID=A0A2Z3H9I5_9BACT|nr:hypothetical protein [Gemmata obscuriglobus]AWM40286.1 hypothetical protein C1280_26965 [Gemmata obscuriglobus]QEG26509.1 hypothetical protein GobsT_12490 [Gemmata obscuriglobus]VTS01815.1 unnamed protein product [Gemmata obscuriglobus UQM 2246]
MKGKSGKAKKAGDLTTGWAKLAPVLGEIEAVLRRIEAFNDDPDTQALREAAPAAFHELDIIEEVLTESAGILARRAALSASQGPCLPSAIGLVRL